MSVARDNRSTVTQIRVVVGMRSDIARAGLIALLMQVDEVQVIDIAKDAPTLERLVQTHRPQVVIAEATMLIDVPRSAWMQARANHPNTELVLVGHASMRLPPRCAMLEYTSGLIFLDDTLEQVVVVVRAAAAGNALFSRRARVMMQEHMSGEHRSLQRYGLGANEWQLLRLVAQGRHDKEVADALGISSRTMQYPLERICHKLGVENRMQAVVVGVLAGMFGDGTAWLDLL